VELLLHVLTEQTINLARTVGLLLVLLEVVGVHVLLISVGTIARLSQEHVPEA